METAETIALVPYWICRCVGVLFEVFQSCNVTNAGLDACVFATETVVHTVTRQIHLSLASVLQEQDVRPKCFCPIIVVVSELLD